VTISVLVLLHTTVTMALATAGSESVPLHANACEQAPNPSPQAPIRRGAVKHPRPQLTFEAVVLLAIFLGASVIGFACHTLWHSGDLLSGSLYVTQSSSPPAVAWHRGIFNGASTGLLGRFAPTPSGALPDNNAVQHGPTMPRADRVLLPPQNQQCTIDSKGRKQRLDCELRRLGFDPVELTADRFFGSSASRAYHSFVYPKNEKALGVAEDPRRARMVATQVA
jgi:hypothetical protein